MNMSADSFRKIKDLEPGLQDVFLSMMDDVELKTKLIPVEGGDFEQLKEVGRGEDMNQSGHISTAHATNQMSTAEAFYRVFCALPKKDRVAVARYIFQDAEIRRTLELTEIPNTQTLNSFAEDKTEMPVFRTIQALREDLGQ